MIGSLFGDPSKVEETLMLVRPAPGCQRFRARLRAGGTNGDKRGVHD